MIALALTVIVQAPASRRLVGRDGYLDGWLAWAELGHGLCLAGGLVLVRTAG